jgi:Holliday junction resolvase RusA-like endonuclease
MRGELVLTITGTPVPKGSLKCVGTNGRHQLIEDNPATAGWREEIRHLAHETADDLGLHADHRQAIGVEITSTLARPASHYGRGRGADVVKLSAPHYPTALRTGDVDKLARLVLDALADAHVLDNDAQVVEVLSRKAYTDDPHTRDALTVPGVRIRVYPIDGPP